MSVLWEILWFIVTVSVIVTVHEFGHFWVARRLGFKVLRFSVGFGKPLWKRVAGPDQIEYVIAALPLGGYVKMLDEREGEVDPRDLPRSFTRKPPWQRILVLLAGPAMNFVFAILVLGGMFWHNGITQVKAVVGEVTADSLAGRAGLRPGDRILALEGRDVVDQRDVIFGLLDSLSANGRAELLVADERGGRRMAQFSVADAEARRRLTDPTTSMYKGLGFEFWVPPIPPVLGQVMAGGPAERAGLQAGDQVVAIDGAAVRDFRDIVKYVASRPGQTIEVRYRRAHNEASTRVLVAADEVDGRKVGRIQVARPSGGGYPPDMIVHTDLPPFAALGRAVTEAWDMTILQARFMWRMLLGTVSLKNLSGPLSIAEFAGESAEAGATQFLGFLVAFSLGIGFLNLLPIPMLDGGQILFQLAEWLKGAPLSERAQALGQQVGIGLIVMLMGLAFYNDIVARFLNN